MFLVTILSFIRILSAQYNLVPNPDCLFFAIGHLRGLFYIRYTTDLSCTVIYGQGLVPIASPRRKEGMGFTSLETWKREEIPYSSRIVPWGLSVAGGPQTALHNATHLYSDQANLLEWLQRESRTCKLLLGFPVWLVVARGTTGNTYTMYLNPISLCALKRRSSP